MRKTRAEQIERTEEESIPDTAPPIDESDSSSSRRIQHKLMVGQVNDPAEREADDIADRVLGALQRNRTTPSTTPGVVGAQGGEAGPEIEASIADAGSGAPLDQALRSRIEPAVGTDLSGVRVHTDGNADELNRAMSARAFTTGNDVFFRSGEYEPGTDRGAHLIAHEAAHVAQQQGSARRSPIRRELVRDRFYSPAEFVNGIVGPKDDDDKSVEYKAALDALKDADSTAPWFGKERAAVLAAPRSQRLPDLLERSSRLLALNRRAKRFNGELVKAHGAAATYVNSQSTSKAKLNKFFKKKAAKKQKTAKLERMEVLMMQLARVNDEVLARMPLWNDEYKKLDVEIKQKKQEAEDEALLNLDAAKDATRHDKNFGLYGGWIEDASFGSGAMNSVAKVNYKGAGEDGGDFKAVFKAEHSGDAVSNTEKGNFFESGISEETPNAALRSVAASKLNNLLGMSVIPRTELGFHMQLGFGQVMELASGRSPHSTVKTRIDDGDPAKVAALESHLKSVRDDASAIVEKDGKKYLEEVVTYEVDWTNPLLRRQLATLQMFDQLIQNCDRHVQNYFIDFDAFGQPIGVMGIDNDLAFGADKTNVETTGKWHEGLPPAIDANVAQRFCSTTPDQVRAAVKGLLGTEEIESLIMRLVAIQQKLAEVDNTGAFVIPRIANNREGMDEWAGLQSTEDLSKPGGKWDKTGAYFFREQQWQATRMAPQGRLLRPDQGRDYVEGRLHDLLEELKRKGQVDGGNAAAGGRINDLPDD